MRKNTLENRVILMVRVVSQWQSQNFLKFNIMALAMGFVSTTLLVLMERMWLADLPK